MKTGGKKTYRKKNAGRLYKRMIAFVLILVLCSIGILTVFAAEEDMVKEPSEVQEEIQEKDMQEVEEPIVEEIQEKVEAPKIEDEQAQVEEPAVLSVAEPELLSLSSTDYDIAPEHHKYIKYNGGDSYTLNLDVNGIYDSSSEKRKIDVLLIIDKSDSMNYSMNNNQSRLDVVKEIVNGKNGMAESILSNENIDGMMAVVTYSGNKSWKDKAWNDASITASWTSTQDTITQKVERINANGGTNCQAGIRTAKEVLKDARTDAEKYVIFLSDGEPTFYYDKNGKTTGEGDIDADGKCSDAAYLEAETISGLEGFYCVGIVSENSENQKYFLSTLNSKPKSQKRGVFFNNSSEELIQTFQKITAKITEYTCRGVTITDTLSNYAEMSSDRPEDYRVVITDNNGNTINQLEYDGKNINPEDLISITYDDRTKTIKAVFPEDYILDQNYKYTIQFEVKPSQMAYDVFLTDGYLDNIGSEASDAPGNMTSSGKAGFFTNTEAELQYIYGKENAEVKNVSYKEKPVLQIQTGTLVVNKEVSGEMGDRTKAFTVMIQLFKRDGTAFTGMLPMIGEIKRGMENVTAPTSKMISFEKGKTEITLSHGQQIRIDNLPIGMKYIVTEDTPEDYEVTYNGQVLQKLEGVITGAIEAEILNNKEYVPPTGIDDWKPELRIAYCLFLTGLAGFAGIAAKTAYKKRKIL